MVITHSAIDTVQTQVDIGASISSRPYAIWLKFGQPRPGKVRQCRHDEPGILVSCVEI
jgi:hypothetical protein